MAEITTSTRPVEDELGEKWYACKNERLSQCSDSRGAAKTLLQARHCGLPAASDGFNWREQGRG